jgi:hypothetical protein
LEGNEITHHVSRSHCRGVRRLSMVSEVDGKGLGETVGMRAGGVVHEGGEESAPVCGGPKQSVCHYQLVLFVSRSTLAIELLCVQVYRAKPLHLT